MHRYTDDEKKFLKEYVKGHTYVEIQKEFINKFGWEITINQVKSSISRYGLNTGLTGYFKKGSIPHNKGKKMPIEVYEKSKHTMFKKGNIPKNYRKIGSERINKDGYIEIKVKDPNIWKLKHRDIWEKNKGKIPKDCIIIFKDGNKQNTDINNLIMIKKSENVILNHSGLSKYNGDLKEPSINLAKLTLEINKSKNKNK